MSCDYHEKHFTDTLNEYSNLFTVGILCYSRFRAIGEKYVWDELIFPGMSESIYTVLQASTDTSFYRRKSFHLFGADFVLTENYIPYLIEINSIPGLNPSTSIIANLVPMLLEDIVKGIYMCNAGIAKKYAVKKSLKVFNDSINF